MTAGRAKEAPALETDPFPLRNSLPLQRNTRTHCLFCPETSVGTPPGSRTAVCLSATNWGFGVIASLRLSCWSALSDLTQLLQGGPLHTRKSSALLLLYRDFVLCPFLPLSALRQEAVPTETTNARACVPLGSAQHVTKCLMPAPGC